MKTIRSMTLIAILSFLLSFSGGGVEADGDTYTVVIDQVDETAAIRDRSIVRTGDVVKFELIAFSSEAVSVSFSDQEPLTTNFTFIEMEFNCKTWAARPLRHGALNAVDMLIERSEMLDEDWSGRAWRPFTGYACSQEPRAAGSRPRYPDALAFARAASGLRHAALERARASQDVPPSERAGLEIHGVRPADCLTLELRRAAVTNFDKSTIPNANKMSRAMLTDALLQRVNETCASLMVLDGHDPFSDPDIIPTRYWYALDFKECKSTWDGTCEATGSFSVPTGYQLCNKTYEEEGRGYEYLPVEFTPRDWIEDGASPPKFRKYDFRMYSSGGGRILNKTSANIKLSNLWITYISDKLDNVQRKKRGCELPNRPAPPPKPTPPPSPLPFVQNNISFPPTPKSEQFRLVMTTPAGGRSMTHYVVEYFDPHVWNRWMLDLEETRSMGPGDTWDYAPIRYGATCWRVRSEYWTPSGWRPGRSYSRKC